jgi:hypothetical protein
MARTVRRQRDILDQLRWRWRLEDGWVTVAQLAGETDDFYARPSDLESTRRAVRKQEVAGKVKTRLQYHRAVTWGTGSSPLE